MPSRTELEGKEILKRIHSHNKNFGGYLVEITAGTGKGKTSMMLSTIDYNLTTFPEEKVFFSDCFDTPIQAFKLGKDKVNILVEDMFKEKIVFRDRDHRLKKIPHEEMGVTYFIDNNDLWNKAVLGKVNVVFFQDRCRWMEFITFLRSIGEFTNVFIDEMSEIAPMMGMHMYRRNEEFGYTCKDIRKCMLNVWYTAQNCSQVDWRVRGAVQVKIFGPGARKDKHCRIHQKAIDNLHEDRERGNEFWIAESGTFGLFRLGDIFGPVEGLNIEAHYEYGKYEQKRGRHEADTPNV